MKFIIGPSRAFGEMLRRILAVAEYDVSVLITGETGTGKEVAARAVHYLSGRAGEAFVPVNCGALPGELVENELFGHERGSYTGAHAGQEGLVCQADGGTLFLDEIDSMPANAQVKLLRLLQSGEYRPIGAGRLCRANLRILAASNRDMDEAVREEKLRADLYYRLNVVRVHLPALRERAEDIPQLARHFLERAARKFRKGRLELEPEALDILMQYAWPGNVRELEHVVQRAALLCVGGKVSVSDLELGKPGEEPGETFQQAKARVVSRFEREYLTAALALNRGNVSQAARGAGKHRRVFLELIRKHDIDVNQFRS